MFAAPLFGRPARYVTSSRTELFRQPRAHVAKNESPWRQMSPPENGVQHWHVDSFAHFYDYLEQEVFGALGQSAASLIWRGQRCSDWSLSSSLDRVLDRMGKLGLAEPELELLARDHLSAFKYAARGRRGSTPDKLAESEWWALGQHYGLATPVLDWTRSPFAAAYFAYSETSSDNTENVAIWSLSQEAVVIANEAMVSGRSVEQGRVPILELIDPLLDENPRLVSQGGLFSRAPIGVTVEAWVTQAFEGEKSPVLTKITLPQGDRKNALQALNRMNINHLTLFPDLTGASLHTNLDLEMGLNPRRSIEWGA